MKQNINLFRLATATAATRPGALHVSLGLSVLAVSLMAAQMWLDGRTAQARQAADDLRDRVAASQEQLNALAAAQMAGADASLEAELKALLTELDSRENILGLSAAAAPAMSPGFRRRSAHWHVNAQTECG